MSFNVEIQGLDQLMTKFTKAGSGEFKRELMTYMDALGFEFLDIVQDEIIRTGTVDTRRLLSSFNKGSGDGIYSLSDGGLTLEVGTNVEYAQYVNDGHFTVGLDSGKDRRWVPGVWVGGKFQYQPGNRESGMLLKQQFVKGTNYWDNAQAIYKRVFDKSLDRKVQEWIDKYF